MKLMFELSKEHATLPSAEVIATLNAEHMNATLISSNEDVLIVETNPNDTRHQTIGGTSCFYICDR